MENVKQLIEVRLTFPLWTLFKSFHVHIADWQSDSLINASISIHIVLKRSTDVFTQCQYVHTFMHSTTANPKHIYYTETYLIPAHHISLTNTLAEGTPHHSRGDWISLALLTWQPSEMLAPPFSFSYLSEVWQVKQ